MNQQEAQAFAENFLKDLTKFERVVEFDAEGETAITTQREVKLTGTATSFDQTYRIDTVHKSLTIEGGFVMNVHLKNHETTSDTSL